MYGSNERKQEITLLHISLNYMTTKDMKRQEITEQLTRALHADDPQIADLDDCIERSQKSIKHQRTGHEQLIA